MIGFLAPDRPAAPLRSLYRSYQCALCHHLGAEYGLPHRLLAGPDLVLYNVFLDAVAGDLPALGRKACVVAPVVTSLPCRDQTDNTALAAAFGVWMMVEKIRDDWRDEGGLHRWLACKALAPGADKARARLEAAGFPVAQILDELARQARLEALPTAPLDQAMGPTRRIARLAYGFAARGRPDLQPAVDGIGDGIGAWLFWVDAMLDWREDRQRGGYNPLARSGQVEGPLPEQLPARLRRHAEAGAEAAIDAISAALPALGRPAAAEVMGLLEHCLQAAPRTRLARLRARPSATSLRALAPPRPPLATRLSALWSRMQQRVASRARYQVLKLRVSVAATLVWAFPGRAWAEEWWPEDPAATYNLDTGDTGWVPPDDGGYDSGGDGTELCDAVAGNCGWCDLESCCDSVCDDVCDISCDPQCG